LNAPVSAVVPVHIYGHMAEMDAIIETARRYKLVVIEDACQAHGAEYFSRADDCWYKAGSMGAAAAFSFYPGKNLGACGEAGAVTTNSNAIVQKVRMLRDHGQVRKYQHDIEGYNGRLDAIQAGFLSVKLKHLAEWNTQRRRAAHVYNRLLADVPEVTRPTERDGARPVYHLYAILAQDRDGLQRSLAEAQIETSIHYPVPLHLQKAYAGLGYARGDFPVAERVASQVLSLPLYPHLSLEQQQRVADAVRAFVAPQPAALRREAEVAQSARTTSPLATD
jgi:dTDP-4-amino-4,6-dideoxygalactose transaminase